jgi:putative transposase
LRSNGFGVCSVMRTFRHAGGVSSLGYHVVWCPKYRQRILVGRVATELECVVRQLAEDLRVEVAAIEIMPDHVHLFVDLRRYIETQRTR